MAGQACKIIINGMLRSISQSLEEILRSPAVRDVMLSNKACDGLIQRMADIDIATYHGLTLPHGGLVGIIKELEAAGVFTDEVWKILARPQ